jgi:hypothetical protein
MVTYNSGGDCYPNLDENNAEVTQFINKLVSETVSAVTTAEEGEERNRMVGFFKFEKMTIRGKSRANMRKVVSKFCKYQAWREADGLICEKLKEDCSYTGFFTVEPDEACLQNVLEIYPDIAIRVVCKGDWRHRFSFANISEEAVNEIKNNGLRFLADWVIFFIFIVWSIYLRKYEENQRERTKDITMLEHDKNEKYSEKACYGCMEAAEKSLLKGDFEDALEPFYCKYAYEAIDDAECKGCCSRRSFCYCLFQSLAFLSCLYLQFISYFIFIFFFFTMLTYFLTYPYIAFDRIWKTYCYEKKQIILYNLVATALKIVIKKLLGMALFACLYGSENKFKSKRSIKRRRLTSELFPAIYVFIFLPITQALIDATVFDEGGLIDTVDGFYVSFFIFYILIKNIGLRLVLPWFAWLISFKCYDAGKCLFFYKMWPKPKQKQAVLKYIEANNNQTEHKGIKFDKYRAYKAFYPYPWDHDSNIQFLLQMGLVTLFYMTIYPPAIFYYLLLLLCHHSIEKFVFIKYSRTDIDKIEEEKIGQLLNKYLNQIGYLFALGGIIAAEWLYLYRNIEHGNGRLLYTLLVFPLTLLFKEVMSKFFHKKNYNSDYCYEDQMIQEVKKNESDTVIEARGMNQVLGKDEEKMKLFRRLNKNSVYENVIELV